MDVYMARTRAYDHDTQAFHHIYIYLIYFAESLGDGVDPSVDRVRMKRPIRVTRLTQNLFRSHSVLISTQCMNC